MEIVLRQPTPGADSLVDGERRKCRDFPTGTPMDGFADRALAVLAIIASIFLLHWGAPFFIPLLWR